MSAVFSLDIAWKEDLLRDGPDAVRQLLDGRARLGVLTAAEPEDAVTAVLFGLKADDPHVIALDDGCSAALEDYRLSLLDLTGTDFQVGLSRLTKLMRIILRVKSAGTIATLHHDYIKWNAFFENFVVDRGLDLRREYWRILAQTQDEVPDSARDPRRLMPLWLSVCSEAGNGGLYDISYLRIGLMGLRGLPLGERSSNVEFALQGLARWAAYREPPKHDFMREWRTLEEEYGFSPNFWPARVENAISALEEEFFERSKIKKITFPASNWWRDDIGSVPNDTRSKFTSENNLPSAEWRIAILDSIDRPFERIHQSINDLMREHRRYADATGDVFYLVRTACNVGMRLIENGDVNEIRDRGEMAFKLARLTFEYDPNNAYAWSLLIRASTAAGRARDGEQIGWEAIRRFPEDPKWKSQLANILIQPLARFDEAEALLRARIDQEPHSAIGYTQLSILLADQLHRRDEAVDLLEKRIEITPNDVNIKEILRRAQEGRRLGKKPPISKLAIPPARIELPTAIACRALFRFEHGLDEITSIQSLLGQGDRDAYLTYVGDRTGARPANYKTTFALAFDAAARAGSADALRILLRRTSSIEMFLTEGSLNLLEGRVLPPLEGFPEWKAARLPAIERALKSTNTSMQQTLLRDVAASYLSTGVQRLLAA